MTVLGKPNSQHLTSMLDLCSETYFQTLGLRLLRGRLLSEDDVASSRPVAVINQAFARTHFGSENPLGQRVKFNDFDHLPDTPKDAYLEVIGIVTDFSNRGLLRPATPEAFLPHSISGLGDCVILAKTVVDPMSLLADVQREVWAVDSYAAVVRSGSIEELMGREVYFRPRFGLITIGAFAGIGLVLVLIGIFSVMAYTVALQTHELGVRMALGAQQGNVLRTILWKGFRLIAAGTVIAVGQSRPDAFPGHPDSGRFNY
jgi:putative ABC transport system permease protein